MTEDNIPTSSRTSFNLHSNQNRRRYPSSEYPLTHAMDRRSIQMHQSQPSTYLRTIRCTLALLVPCLLISTLILQVHVHLHNAVFGPMYLDLQDFIAHVNKYQKGQSWFWKTEYIQVELREENIQQSTNQQTIIRYYSDPATRLNHIATMKQLVKPRIYIKLPTVKQKYARTRLPFDFQLYTVSTLKCIVRNLPGNSVMTYRTWVKKIGYVQYIDEQYNENTTQFNIAVLSKCGILIGYLYRPVHEKAFRSTYRHHFSESDIAFNATQQPYSLWMISICGLIFFFLIVILLYNFIIYSTKTLRLRICHKYGYFSCPLLLIPNDFEELWLLNLNSQPYEQLLQLDQFIRHSRHKYHNRLFIIENHSEDLFLILLRKDFNDILTISATQSLFIVCPVRDVRKITHDQGICYGHDLSWIPWPEMFLNDFDCSIWLHEKLMQLSENYRNQYEHRLQYEHPSHNSVQSNHPRQRYLSHHTNTNHSAIRWRPSTRTNSTDDREFEQMVLMEENIQRLNLELQHPLQCLLNPPCPASSQFIANFRLQRKRNEKFVNLSMHEENLNCTVCLGTFQLNDSYTTWPCPQPIPHIFHWECMLQTLRQMNTCPICRHPVPTDSRQFYQLPTLLTRILSPNSS